MLSVNYGNFLRKSETAKAAYEFKRPVYQFIANTVCVFCLAGAVTSGLALAYAYMNNLSPHEITAPNPVLSAIVERPVNHLAGLMKFTAHTAYHLGCCDALLRERGLPGVY